MAMQVKIGIGEAHVTGAEGIVSQEQFTFHELSQMADFIAELEMSDDDPMQRLMHLLYALTNDTDAFVIMKIEA
jgi:hypothetical protein